MQNVIAFVMGNLPMIFAVLFLVSELLSFIPAVKANGVFQLLFGWIKKGHEQFPEIKK